MTYPEHEKMAAVVEHSQEIGRFLDEFLPSKGIVLARAHPEYDDELVPVWDKIEALLAEFYGIDLDKVEAEKLAMLVALRGTP